MAGLPAVYLAPYQDGAGQDTKRAGATRAAWLSGCAGVSNKAGDGEAREEIMAFIDYVLGALVAVYYSYRRLFSRDSRCPKSEDGIHLSVVRDGDYRCKDCGRPQTRIGPGADGVDR